MRDVIENEILGKPNTPTADRLRWHLAAFYWELVATFECTLQVISAHHKLGLERGDIVWKNNVERALADRKIQDNLTEKVASVYQSDWFADVLARRNNVTHRDAPFVQVAVVNGLVIAVGTVRHPDLLKQCSAHLERMKELVAVADKTLPAGHMFFAQGERSGPT